MRATLQRFPTRCGLYLVCVTSAHQLPLANHYTKCARRSDFSVTSRAAVTGEATSDTANWRGV